MKGIQVIIFFTIFFSLFALLNYYIFIRGWQTVGYFGSSRIKMIYVIAFLVFSLSYLLTRFIGKYLPLQLADGLAFFGSMWFGVMLYLILFLVAVDIFRLLAGWLSLYPASLAKYHEAVKVILFGVGVFLTGLVLITGYFNANRLIVSQINIELTKPGSQMNDLHLVMATDIHLGHIIDEGYLSKLINKINELEPDIVLFPGDLVDEEMYPVKEKGLGALFSDLKAPMGVFAVTGNHEYIGGAKEAVDYFSNYNITFLRDETRLIGNSFYLCGREDISMNSFSGRKRKALKELLGDCDKRFPVVVMDHQPVSLTEAIENDVDLQVSGHTHHGQMWPLNYITSRIYKLSRGYLKKGNSHFYVSTGAGTWGPRVRIGNSPEIVSVRISTNTQR